MDDRSRSPYGHGPMTHGLMGLGSMGQGPMGHGPMGQGPMGQGPMCQGPMGQGPMGQGPMSHGGFGQGPMHHGPMGHGFMPGGPGQGGARPSRPPVWSQVGASMGFDPRPLGFGMPMNRPMAASGGMSGMHNGQGVGMRFNLQQSQAQQGAPVSGMGASLLLTMQQQQRLAAEPGVPGAFAAPVRPVFSAEQQAAAAAATAKAAAEAEEAARAATEAEEQAQRRQARLELQEAVEKSEGYFEATLGEVLCSDENKDTRFTVVAKRALGVGVFSVVWPCADKDNKLIALKVVRKQDHFRKYAEKEVEILSWVKDLADKDPEGSSQVAMLREHFVYKIAPDTEHLCMAFEKLENNLRTLGRQPLDKVLSFSKQIMLALRYLHEVVGLVHCDVKPDNLLLRWDGLAVKLCDFGTARLSPDLQAIDELQPLYYRAPEVYVGAPRGRKIDIWSAGCTIYELVVGRVLFRTCNGHREVLEKIMQLCGPVPLEVRQNGRLTQLYFTSKGFQREAGGCVDADTFYKKSSMLSELASFADFGKENAKTAQEQAKAQLSRLIGATTVIGAASKRTGGVSPAEQRLKLLADLVEKCMDVNSATRITAKDACEHEALKSVDLPPQADLQEAPPLPEEAPPPLPAAPPPPPS